MDKRPGPRRTQLTIEKMAPEGKGLARVEGRIVFIPHSAPQDRLEVALDRVKEGYALGRMINIIKPGPGRIDPPCPLHYALGRGALPCGGCDWQHLSPSAQLEAKRAIVVDCLERIGKLRGVPVAPTLPSPAAWRYRNKVQVPFGLGEDGKVSAGFYAAGSHKIVDFADCPVQPELSVRIVQKVKALAAELAWTIYEEDHDRGWLRHLLVRTNAEGKALAVLVTRTPDFPARERFLLAMREAFPELVGLHQNVQPEKTSVILGSEWRLTWGQAQMRESLGPLTLQFSPSAFLQVNTPASEVLYGTAKSFLTDGGFSPKLLLDLYSGVGSIALWMADAAGRVLGIEENRQAVADACENARLNRVKNARFLAGSVETLLRKVGDELDQFEPGDCAAVIDPPRSGCHESVLRALRAAPLRRVVYVSCNPATLARDAGLLCAWGYRLAKVQPVDMFPQTSHVEAVALLEREGVRR